mgnify:CR=1 FL=1
MTDNSTNCFIESIMKNITTKDFPRLDTKNRKGHTDYIDYIFIEEITNPIMKGVDCYNRPFIVLKCMIDDEIYGQTFFQRYTDNFNLWMGCSLYGAKPFIDTVGGMTKHQALLLTNIINKEPTIIDENHKPTYNNGKSLINKSVRLIE